MKEYDVKITEILEKVVTIQAESREKAEQMVNEGWRQSEYILGSDDFVDVSIVAEKERVLSVEQMDVLLVEPGQIPRPFQMGIRLEDLQQVVGGDVAITYPFEETIGIVHHEEGNRLGLPLNRALRTEDDEVYEIFAGPFLVVGVSEDGFGSLSSEQMAKYEAMFYQPELFVKMGKSVMVLPMQKGGMEGKESGKDAIPKVKAGQDRGTL